MPFNIKSDPKCSCESLSICDMRSALHFPTQDKSRTVADKDALLISEVADDTDHVIHQLWHQVMAAALQQSQRRRGGHDYV